jgi:hypothetical protein
MAGLGLAMTECEARLSATLLQAINILFRTSCNRFLSVA